MIEFVIVATFFFMMLVGICSVANLYFTHNALVESTRRGARYAAVTPATSPAGTLKTTAANTCDSTGPNLTAIKNVTIYGNAAGTGNPLARGLQASNVCVEYSSFGLGKGSVSVKVINYNFSFSVPLIGHSVTMPGYKATVAGESAGVTP